jgi:hypothetical protein
MHAPSSPDARGAPWCRLAEGFAAIAAGIEARQSDASLTELFTQTHVLCEEVIARESQADAKALAGNVQLAVRTWQQVWPRLGGQTPFRQAVSREARMWSKRLLEGFHRPMAS